MLLAKTLPGGEAWQLVSFLPAEFDLEFTLFDNFSAKLQLSHDYPVVTGEGLWSTHGKDRLTPRQWQLSHLPLTGFEPLHW